MRGWSAGLGLSDSIDSVISRISVDAPRNQSLLLIYARDSDPGRAAAIANKLAEELIAASPALQGRAGLYEFLDRDLAATQRQIELAQSELDGLLALPSRTAAQDQQLESLRSRLTSLRASYAELLSFALGSSPGLLSVVEPAEPVSTPVSPRPLFNTMIAGVLGLLVALAIAFTVEQLDDTLKNPEDVDKILGLPTLGEIGRIRGGAARRGFYRLVTLLYARSPIAEAFRTLRTNIEFTALDAPLRTLVVTSALPQEGKTTVAANIAVVFAQSGRSTILVDADLRRPGVHEMFNLPNTQGLTTLLRSDEASIDSVAHQTEVQNLRVITTGPLAPNPAEVLGSDRMTRAIERLKAEAEIVIFDTPPTQAVTDAVVLAARVDGSILVIRAGRTRTDAARRSRDALSRVNAKILGVVLNHLRGHGGAQFYQTYYGARADSARTTPEVDAPATPTAVTTGRSLKPGVDRADTSG